MLQWSITVIAGSGPHQTSPHHAESANVRQQDEPHNLEHEKDLAITRKAACKLSTQVEVVFGEKVMQCISKVMKKLCNEKLMI